MIITVIFTDVQGFCNLRKSARMKLRMLNYSILVRRERIYSFVERIDHGSYMKCPFCGYVDSKVVDTRPADEGVSIRRRRECLKCQRRFTTYEIVESLPLIVIKKDGSRQAFDRNKLLGGLFKACEKRPVSLQTLERLVDEVEAHFQNSLQREVESRQIGELVMDKLKRIDEIAYVRFASVYRQFKDINSFIVELNRLKAENSE